MKKKELSKLSGVSSSSIVKLTKEQNTTTDVLSKICSALDCDFKEVLLRGVGIILLDICEL
jgi:putative transcriptional regulator